MDDASEMRSAPPPADPPASWEPATLDGLRGEAHPPPAAGGVGTWQGELDEAGLLALLRAAAVGARLPYRDARGGRRVVVRRCWVDPVAGRVRASFAVVGLPA